MRRQLVILFLGSWFAGTAAQRPLRIVEWNVENLFDCRHDSLKQDQDFALGGAYGWTWGRYWKKINDLSRVALAIGNESPPDLMGLCEVENDSTMRDLSQRSMLRTLGYSYVMTDSPDRRGVDVALMYRPARFSLLDWHAVGVPSAQHGLPPTRDLLWAVGLMPDGDTLHVVVCHLPSRLGGAVGSRNRRLAAETLAHLVDSIGAWRNILVMGDFNAPPRDKIFRLLPMLTDLAPRKRHPDEGSYRYKGLWSWIDHVLVSPPLEARTGPLQLYTAPWLQDKDSHGGWHPRRTYLGPAYHGGVSDHVPIWLDLK